MFACMNVCICRNIKSVGVSAVSGEGIATLFECLKESRVEFQETYLPELERSALNTFLLKVCVCMFVCGYISTYVVCLVFLSLGTLFRPEALVH